MEKNKIINGTRNGYWEYYYYNGKLLAKGNFINSKRDGYWEIYNSDGKLYLMEYYII